METTKQCYITEEELITILERKFNVKIVVGSLKRKKGFYFKVI